MRVSVGLPTGMEGLTYPIPFSEPETVIRIAQHAEALGYHSVWGNDHMTTQQYVRAEFETPPRFWEPLITYSFVAAATETLRFGTGILVLPMRRDIVVTAKQIATLDHFSGGRLEIGLGIGAYREEFDALQPDSGLTRARIIDEGIPALKMLLKERVASFDGDFFKYRDVELYPKPKQDHLPIYIGGNNAANLRRTAKWADGWLPAAVHIDRLRDDVRQLYDLAAAEGHPSEVMDMSFANQFQAHLALIQAKEAGEEMPKAVLDLPEELDQQIARVKLETMGLQIDELTQDQIEYATDYSAKTIYRYD